MQKVIVGFLLLAGTIAEAQSFRVNKENVRIKNNEVAGYEVEIDGHMDEVSAALNKYLKTFARLKPGANPIVTSEVVIKGNSYKSPLYAMVREKGEKAVAWMGIRPEEWADAAEAEKINAELERMVRDFALTFYRDRMQAQIDESQRALQAVERQQQRLATENRNLNIRLENNQQEKVQLEKALEANKQEYISLLSKLEQNKKSQDSLAVVQEQIKKVLEQKKEKQRQIE